MRLTRARPSGGLGASDGAFQSWETHIRHEESPPIIAHSPTRNAARTGILMALALCAGSSCTSGTPSMDPAKMREFATQYTAAWCSQQAGRVASFFAENGSLTINDGTPSVGRAAITAAAQGFMTAFPDMMVKMDDLSLQQGRAIYRWTLTGTNTGPGGTGNAVRISGYEEWAIGADGLIAESKGHFDEAEYQRQLKAGAEPVR